MKFGVSIASIIVANFPIIALAQDQTTPAPPFTSQPPTYSVGDTPVSKLPIGKVAATAVPSDLTLQAQAQTKLAESLATKPAAQALGAKPTSGPVHLPGCDPSAPSVDWRSQQAVSTPKNQGDCGDCFVFAATGAFEASWYLQNGQKISVSEQQLLDCAAAGDCSGGWHGNVLNFLRSKGVGSEGEIPYTGIKNPSCRPSNNHYTAINWAYVDSNGSMASPTAIKEAICAHGPVVSAVYATREFQMYTGGVFNQFAEGDGASSINHDVLIIGWDNVKDAWLIKNSWDTSWGEGGFMWIRYRSNWIGYGAAWVDAVKINPTSAVNDVKRGVQLNSNAINSIIRGFSSEILGDKPSSDSLKRALGFR